MSGELIKLDMRGSYRIREYIAYAIILSIFAALNIEYLLYNILFFREIDIIYIFPNIFIMIMLISVGILAYIFYLKSVRYSYTIMKYISPISMAVALTSIVISVFNVFHATSLIIAAYSLYNGGDRGNIFNERLVTM